MMILETWFVHSWILLVQMAPYLWLGFLAAALIHVFVPENSIERWLSSVNFASVFKAALLGVPLPLCSCSVIPVASHLHDKGASKGATMSFLTSTPTTGVDSLLATYSLLGWFFTIARALVALLAGIVVGCLINLYEALFAKGKQPENLKAQVASCSGHCHEDAKAKQSLKGPKAFMHALENSIKDIGPWMVFGLLIGGAIATFLPEQWFVSGSGSSKVWLSYLVMCVVGLPMYVCATGSIPIAVALMAKGLTPGAALIFLLCGPATNSVTLAFVAGRMGVSVLWVYGVCLGGIAIAAGWFLDLVWPYFGQEAFQLSSAHEAAHFSSWSEVLAVALLLFILKPVLQKFLKRA